jgi:hypothetical protein
MYPAIEYMTNFVGEDLRMAGIYTDDDYEVQYVKDEVDTVEARQRAERYVEFTREDNDRTTSSGALPFDRYHADIRMFDGASIFNLPLSEKEYNILFSLDPDAARNYRAIIREVHRKTYEKPPALFR